MNLRSGRNLAPLAPLTVTPLVPPSPVVPLAPSSPVRSLTSEETQSYAVFITNVFQNFQKMIRNSYGPRDRYETATEMFHFVHANLEQIKSDDFGPTRTEFLTTVLSDCTLFMINSPLFFTPSLNLYNQDDKELNHDFRQITTLLSTKIRNFLN